MLATNQHVVVGDVEHPRCRRRVHLLRPRLFGFGLFGFGLFGLGLFGFGEFGFSLFGFGLYSCFVFGGVGFWGLDFGVWGSRSRAQDLGSRV